MKKIIIKLIIVTLYNFVSFTSYGEIYNTDTITEIKDIAKDIFAKRDPQKVLFIFSLEKFILKPTLPVMHKYDNNYNSLLEKALNKVPHSKLFYAKELILSAYPNELADKHLAEMIDYFQSNKAAIIITTPNVTGNINNINYFDKWTVDHLKTKGIDLSKGVFAEIKFSFDKEAPKVRGTYPSFYQGLLSCNTDEIKNSEVQVLSILLAKKLNITQNMIIVVSNSKGYLETLEKQFQVLQIKSEFLGILYTPKENNDHVKEKEISPEEYFKFWQDFAQKLLKLSRKDIDTKQNNPYEE